VDKKKAFYTTGIILLLIGVLALADVGIAQISSLTLYADPDSIEIQYGQPVTITVYDPTLGSEDVMQVYLDGIHQGGFYYGNPITYTTPSNLAIGHHKLTVTDFMGQIVEIPITITAQPPTPTPTPTEQFYATLTPSSATIKPNTQQTFTLQINGGTAPYSIYWNIDDQTQNKITTYSKTNTYIAHFQNSGIHTLKATITDNTLQTTTTTTTTITVTQNIPTPNLSPTLNPTQTPKPTTNPTNTPQQTTLLAQALQTIAGIFTTFIGTILLIAAKKQPN
jgi:hypothetical protein